MDAKGLTATLRPTHCSPSHSRRRATLHAEAKGGRVLIGFSEEKSHAIVDMAECHILHPTLFALVAPLRALLQRLGFKRRGDVQLALSDMRADIL